MDSCRCEIIFPLVGPTELQNDVSKMLIVKKQTFINCFKLLDTKTRNDEKMTSLRKATTLHFDFLGEYSKVKT